MRLDPTLNAAAIELANLLTARGERVRAAGLIDTVLSNLPSTDSLFASLAARSERLADGESLPALRNPFIE